VHEVLLELREVLKANCGAEEVFIDVLLATMRDAKRVRAFMSMSGCSTNIDKADGHFVVRASGRACCV